MEPCNSANKQSFSGLENQSFSGLPSDPNDRTIEAKSKNMPRSIDIINVIALLCRKHKISMKTLENIILSESHHFDYCEMMMAEQFNKQLVDKDLILESIHTLDIDFDANIDPYVPEPVDLTDTDNEFEENEFEENEEVDDIDDVGNDPDYIPDPEPKKPRIFKENFPRWKWEKAYRYWTRQDDYSKPIIISRIRQNIGKAKENRNQRQVPISQYSRR